MKRKKTYRRTIDSLLRNVEQLRERAGDSGPLSDGLLSLEEHIKGAIDND